MRFAKARAAALLLVAFGACGGDDPAESPGPSDEVPPIESRAMEQWLDDGTYLEWTCEPALRPPRGESPHGQARICQNALLRDDEGNGPYPLGAASVKEQGDNDVVEIVSVVVRGSEDDGGAGWYWWRRNERLGNVLLGDFGVGECTDCHAAAPRDFVFTRLE